MPLYGQILCPGFSSAWSHIYSTRGSQLFTCIGYELKQGNHGNLSVKLFLTWRITKFLCACWRDATLFLLFTALYDSKRNVQSENNPIQSKKSTAYVTLGAKWQARVRREKSRKLLWTTLQRRKSNDKGTLNPVYKHNLPGTSPPCFWKQD